ncbi:uncharacterized protein A4U43_C03F2220, partial [Asparagus officinalis]
MGIDEEDHHEEDTEVVNIETTIRTGQGQETEIMHNDEEIDGDAQIMLVVMHKPLSSIKVLTLVKLGTLVKTLMKPGFAS